MPEPTPVAHACPPKGSGVMPCCGRTPFEVPRTDRISVDPFEVTCGQLAPADVRDQIVRAVSRVLLDSAGRLVPNHIAETAQAVSDTADAVLRVPAIAEALKAAAGISDIARGYCPHCGRGDAAPTTDQWLHERRRAEQAEATGGEARTALAIQKAISADLRVESRARGEKLERVRQLHRSERSDMGWDECGECRTPYPCPTIAALDPQEQP